MTTRQTWVYQCIGCGHVAECSREGQFQCDACLGFEIRAWLAYVAEGDEPVIELDGDALAKARGYGVLKVGEYDEGNRADDAYQDAIAEEMYETLLIDRLAQLNP